jgi:colicin import membrane protein
MTANAQRLEFAPPPVPGFLRAFGLAIIAHALLVAALTWGVSWRRDAVELAAEAELWAQVPVQAAPKLVEAPVAPSAPPVAEKPVETPPKAVDPDIVTQREKQRLAQEKRLHDEKQAQLDKLAADKKLEAEKKKELKKQEELKLAEAAKRKEALAKAEEQKRELERQETIKRSLGLAGATGPSTATGNAQQSAGPSSSYSGRIRSRIKPNIVFTEDIAGNPTAVVEVRTSPDGTIIGRTLLKKSGVPAWDESVLKAIDKTEVLPRDSDGRVPPSLEISFRPKD